MLSYALTGISARLLEISLFSDWFMSGFCTSVATEWEYVGLYMVQIEGIQSSWTKGTNKSLISTGCPLLETCRKPMARAAKKFKYKQKKDNGMSSIYTMHACVHIQKGTYKVLKPEHNQNNGTPQAFYSNLCSPQGKIWTKSMEFEISIKTKREQKGLRLNNSSTPYVCLPGIGCVCACGGWLILDMWSQPRNG